MAAETMDTRRNLGYDCRCPIVGEPKKKKEAKVPLLATLLVRGVTKRSQGIFRAPGLPVEGCNAASPRDCTFVRTENAGPPLRANLAEGMQGGVVHFAGVVFLYHFFARGSGDLNDREPVSAA